MLFATGFWFTPGASTMSGEIDWLFNFILIISAIFFAIIIGVGSYFVVKYRRRPGHAPEASPAHNTKLEIFWSVIPSILIVFMFAFGVKTYLKVRATPPGAYEINVTAQTWSWMFHYPDGTMSNDLYVPAGRPVKLTLTSEDVIHSLFVPDFRLKMDAVPGQYTSTWFEAPEPGVHQLYCTEYCGTKHSDMLAKVIVYEEDKFDQWLEEAGNFHDNMTPVEAGRYIYNLNGCAQCHSVDGAAGIGPTFKGSYGRVRRLANGENVTVDENYIRESILNPQAKIAEGFGPNMPTYKGRLDDRDITALIALLKSLKD